MTDTFYPNITDATLIPIKVVISQIQQNPAYLDSADCPFSEGVKKALREMFAPRPATASAGSIFLGRDGDKWAAMEAECASLYGELKTFGAGLNNTNTSEKMAFFRTSTNLLEKIVTINERAMGLKQLADFQTAVLEVMDSILDPSQRTTVMNKLKATIGQEAAPVEVKDAPEEA